MLVFLLVLTVSCSDSSSSSRTSRHVIVRYANKYLQTDFDPAYDSIQKHINSAKLLFKSKFTKPDLLRVIDLLCQADQALWDYSIFEGKYALFSSPEAISFVEFLYHVAAYLPEDDFSKIEQIIIRDMHVYVISIVKIVVNPLYNTEESRAVGERLRLLNRVNMSTLAKADMLSLLDFLSDTFVLDHSEDKFSHTLSQLRLLKHFIDGMADDTKESMFESSCPCRSKFNDLKKAFFAELGEHREYITENNLRIKASNTCKKRDLDDSDLSETLLKKLGEIASKRHGKLVVRRNKESVVKYVVVSVVAVLVIVIVALLIKSQEKAS